MISIVPRMSGWIRQWNGYWPAALNTSPPDAPLPRFGVVQVPSSSVAVCGMGSLFVKVMTWPTSAVTRPGAKDDPEIRTATAPVSEDGSQAEAAGSVAGASVAVGVDAVVGSTVGAGTAVAGAEAGGASVGATVEESAHAATTMATRIPMDRSGDGRRDMADLLRRHGGALHRQVRRRSLAGFRAFQPRWHVGRHGVTERPIPSGFPASLAEGRPMAPLAPPRAPAVAVTPIQLERTPFTSLHAVAYRGPVSYPVNAAIVRRLLLHEAAVHAVPGRELTDLGDGVLLLDPADPEPFWNRLAAVRWPDEPAAFDRRLTEVLLRFAAKGRQPHVWVSPPHDQPADLVARLAANGFEDTGPGLLMVADGPTAARAALDRPAADPTVRIRRTGSLTNAAADAEARPIVDVLLGAFGVGEERRPGVTAETLASLRDPRFMHYVVLVGDRPAAVARRATFDGLTYLSSIGTAPWARGRGLGRLVTATATADGFAAGSAYVHLGVFVDNDPAVALYLRLGFQRSGDPGPDMLLVGR